MRKFVLSFLSVYACLLIHRDHDFARCCLCIFNHCLYWLIHKRSFLCLMSSLHCSPGPPRALPGWVGWSSGGDSWNWPDPSVSAVQMSKRIKEMCRAGRVFASHFTGLDVDCFVHTQRKLFIVYFFGGLEWVGHYMLMSPIMYLWEMPGFESRELP